MQSYFGLTQALGSGSVGFVSYFSPWPPRPNGCILLGMPELGPTRVSWKLAIAPAVAAISALLVETAFAQANTLTPPPVVSPTDFPNAPVIKENPQMKRARENAYRRALEKIPDKKLTKPVDPWENMRSTATSQQSRQ